MSYHNIRMQNQAWARMISAQKTSMPTLRKGIVTHSTIDNNDGRQEPWTGLGTTHDTNNGSQTGPVKGPLTGLLRLPNLAI